MESDNEFLQDNVKVVLHVQAQKRWDDAVDTEFELTPLTRPYGLEPGMVFQAELLAGGRRATVVFASIPRRRAGRD